VELSLDIKKMLILQLDPCSSTSLSLDQLADCKKSMVLLRVAAISELFSSMGFSLILAAQLYKLYLHYEKGKLPNPQKLIAIK